jgi:hypothetical protein
MPRFSITGEIDIGYYLVLNDMRGRLEGQTPFGPYDSAEAALAFHDSEKAPESWKDPIGERLTDPCDYHGKVFNKSFKKGSALEWMNPLMPYEREKPGSHGHGVHRVLENLEIKTQTRIG